MTSSHSCSSMSQRYLSAVIPAEHTTASSRPKESRRPRRPLVRPPSSRCRPRKRPPRHRRRDLGDHLVGASDDPPRCDRRTAVIGNDDRRPPSQPRRRIRPADPSTATGHGDDLSGEVPGHQRSFSFDGVGPAAWLTDPMLRERRSARSREPWPCRHLTAGGRRRPATVDRSSPLVGSHRTHRSSTVLAARSTSRTTPDTKSASPK